MAKMTEKSCFSLTSRSLEYRLRRSWSDLFQAFVPWKPNHLALAGGTVCV